MPRPDAIGQPSFDVKKFFANIICIDEDDQFSAMIGMDGANLKIFELFKRLRQKETRKRTQGRCMFNLSPNSQIGLAFYNTIMPAKKTDDSKSKLIQ